MASTRQIKSRIRSVSSNKQITKAMELVAASKLRKSQEAALRTRKYADMALEILASLSRLSDVSSHDLFTKRQIRRRLLIVITSDRGLAGAYNANVLKLLANHLQIDKKTGVSTEIVTIGRKGAQFAAKLKDVSVVGSYEVGDTITQDEIRPIILTAANKFRSGEVDSVELIGTNFVNSFVQTAKRSTLLPAGVELLESNPDLSQSAAQEMTFEPSIEQVLQYTVQRLIEAQLFQALLDSLASEHAMRRVAMKNASDNASDIVDALTLEMNKVRQAGITQELSEISAGVEAMK